VTTHPVPKPGGSRRPARPRPAGEGGREAAALRSRGAELRMAAALPSAELRPILDAALAEVEAAADALSGRRGGDDRGPSSAAHAERRLLHQVFQQLPVPVFLLGQDRTIRRTNAAAAELLGSAPGYATGKQFAALVDVPDRARVKTQLATAFRTGQRRRLTCGLLSADGPVPGELTLCLAGLRGDADQLIVAVTASGPVTSQKGRAGDEGEPSGEGEPAAGQADLELVRRLTRRMDLAADITRLLLESITVSESAMVQRCARALAGEFGGWVMVDLERRGRLRRHFVAGPDGPEAEELARVAAEAAPEPGSAPWIVHEAASSQLFTHAEETDILGPGPDGMTLDMLLRATSVLSVPLSDGERSYGALTLVRQASHGHFGLSDVAVAEAVGEQLALAIRADRMFRRHSAVAEALQASLLPRELLPVPGVEIAAAHLAAEGPDVGGDFYDVYAAPGGSGLVMGDVCGTARDTAAVTSAARQAIRVIGRSEPDPAEVLRGANDVLLDENLAGQFVTAHAACLRWNAGRLQVALGSAGQPAPAIITADGQVRQLRGGGQPLGIFPDAEPSVQQLELSTGDVLFFFTDGVADARHGDSGYFGDRLADELAALADRPATEIVAGLRRRVLEFCNGEIRDDMTMLALRVAEPPDV
jgi:serine phosphatase RsbU (regulator of sigma subunit)/PAS domain-containing protein